MTHIDPVATPRAYDLVHGVYDAAMNAEAGQWAEVYSRTLQELADDLLAQPVGSERRRELVRLVRRSARIGLKPGEVRTLKVGDNDASVFAVAGGSFTRVDVRRSGELLNAFSGTRLTENEALLTFAGSVGLLLKF